MKAENPPRKPTCGAEVLRMYAHGPKYGSICVTFGRTLVEEMVAMHDKVWFGHLMWAKQRDKERRYDMLRLQVAPFQRLDMPAMFVRIRPPTADAKPGYKLRRSGRQFTVELRAKKIGLRNYAPTVALDYAYAPSQFGPHGGIIVWFPEGYFKPPTARQRKSLKADEDLFL